MTWMDIGSGWRNLFLLSCLVQMGSLGCLFAARGWFFKKSRTACFLTGVASTPLVQYLWTLLLAVLWPNAPRLVYIGALPLLGVLCVLVLAVRRVRHVREKAAQMIRYVKRLMHFDKPALIALCFALCMMLMLAPPMLRMMSSMESVRGGDAGEYMALALRYCEDRELGKLLEKEETVGHFRGHSHFPSLELYMSYGLFHTDADQLGYPNDKAAFAGVGMLIFYAAAAYAALLLVFCREKKVCVLLGALLFNLVPDLYYAVALAPRDIWRILALLLLVLVFAGMDEAGSGKAYAGKLLKSFAVCFVVMSAHVVSFVVLPFIVAAWVLWRFLHSGLTVYRGAWRALARSVGIALAGAVGTLAGFAGNLFCFVKWGQMSPWRLMTTYTEAPWYSMYMDMEYKLDETTTSLNFFESLDTILLDFASPVGKWGLYAAVIALIGVLVCLLLARRSMKRRVREVQAQAPNDGPVAVFVTNRSTGAELASLMGLCAMTVLLTLAPMTGLLDSPLYSFSGAFLALPRYTLQWFILACVMICAILAALADLWPVCCERLQRLNREWVKKLPVWLCAALCVLGFVKGIGQTGYSNSLYRFTRTTMEDETTHLDNSFRYQYDLLMAVAEEVPEDQKILITRVGYQYALRGRGYILTSNPIVHLMNLPLEEVEGALKEMNVAVLATEPEFWDERYYPLSTLNEYLCTLPAEQIVESPNMRLYLLDPALVPCAQKALAAYADSQP